MRYTKILIILLLSFFIVANLFAAITLDFFSAKPANDGILIEWKSINEDGVSVYTIERSADNLNNFISIKNINATGNNSYYSYLDENVMIKMTSTVYYYRLKCIKPDGTYTYTNAITVIHSVSGIKETWGSIKAIFR